jgi:hypothetical protein
MCRARGDGGRRCRGCQGPTALAKHNDRRRANRAIRRNVVEWARQRGYLPAELERLAAAPPNVAKKWVEARGMSPDGFVDDVPAGGPGTKASAPPEPLQAAPASVPAAAASLTAGRARRAGAGGVGGGGGGPAAGAGTADPDAPGWTKGTWCTAELQGQIQAVVQTQGSHRDERSLLGGVPVKTTTLGNRKSSGIPKGGANTTRRIELDNGAVGYFKPFGGENKQLERGFGQDSAQQSLHEAAAWRLASQLGPPWSEIVPPVVIREVDGEIGSFALERPGKAMSSDPWGTGEWREAAFFDCLIGQQDRHPGNFLVAGDRISLIDHGYTFARPGDYRNYSWFAARRVQTDPALTYHEREAIQRLVSSPNLMGLQDVLQPARAQALRDRAEKMLADSTIRQGY